MQRCPQSPSRSSRLRPRHLNLCRKKNLRPYRPTRHRLTANPPPRPRQPQPRDYKNPFRNWQGSALQAAEKRVPEGAGGLSPRNECEFSGPSGLGLSRFPGPGINYNRCSKNRFRDWPGVPILTQLQKCVPHPSPLVSNRLFSRELGYGICSYFSSLLARKLSERLHFRVGGDSPTI